MTIEEKRARVSDYCESVNCKNCLLRNKDFETPLMGFLNGLKCLIIGEATESDLDKALEIIDDKEAIENDKKSGNPYWDRITALANKQRETGIKEYGRGLEDDTANIDIRLNRISEELIDALMYIEHLRDGIKEVKNEN